MTKLANRDRHPRLAAGTSTRAADPRLSIVVPMHDEADNVEPLLRRLLPVLDGIATPADVLCVDDGSGDETAARLHAACLRDPRIKIIRLSRNFGKEVAIAAGLAYAKGDAVVLMDADLQHPPELIPTFLDRWRSGFDMVYGIRRRWRKTSWARRMGSRLFYRFFSLMANTDIPPGAGDFRLLDRRVVDAMNACPERSRYNNGLFAWVGFRHEGVPFDVDERVNGRSAWSTFALWRFAIDAVTSFSMMPLRVWSYLGGLVSLLALSYGAFIVVRTLLFGRDVPGYASLITAITFFSGVHLIGLGVIGEYLGRVYTEVKRRPLFVVAEEVGIAAGSDAALPGGASGLFARAAAIPDPAITAGDVEAALVPPPAVLSVADAAVVAPPPVMPAAVSTLPRRA